MKHIVITGSTRGIGYGLADAFLKRGCSVMVSGRSQEAVDKAVEELVHSNGPDRVSGQACDMTDFAQVQGLWDAAHQRFGVIDIWINNAGQGHLLTPVWEIEPEKMQQVINTNILGTLYGTKVAIQGMMKQGHGFVYTLEGYGSRGKRIQQGLAVYGTTKAALAFLDNSLFKELEGKPVKAGVILPGMVVTDLLMNQRSGDPENWERSKRAFNILAERVETVAPLIAEEVLKNDRHGRRISMVSGPKIMWRFLTAPFVKRNVID